LDLRLEAVPLEDEDEPALAPERATLLGLVTVVKLSRSSTAETRSITELTLAETSARPAAEVSLAFVMLADSSSRLRCKPAVTAVNAAIMSDMVLVTSGSLSSASSVPSVVGGERVEESREESEERFSEASGVRVPPLSGEDGGLPRGSASDMLEMSEVARA
jgi:hypothetical protein